MASSKPIFKETTSSDSQKTRLSALLKRTTDRVLGVSLGTDEFLSFYDEYEEFSRRAPGESLAKKAAQLESVSFLKHNILLECGLKPSDSLLDFCCGLDSMAAHTVPYLSQGHYLGMEVSETALENTRRELLDLGVRESNATWLLETDSHFPLLGDQSVDMVSSFTVFSHMSPTDILKYLVGLKRVLKNSGTFVGSFLLLEENSFAKQLLKSGSNSYQGLSIFPASRSFIEEIVSIAGMEIETWFQSSSEAFEFEPGNNDFAAFGQAVAVIKK